MQENFKEKTLKKTEKEGTWLYKEKTELFSTRHLSYKGKDKKSKTSIISVSFKAVNSGQMVCLFQKMEVTLGAFIWRLSWLCVVLLEAKEKSVPLMEYEFHSRMHGFMNSVLFICIS